MLNNTVEFTIRAVRVCLNLWFKWFMNVHFVEAFVFENLAFCLLVCLSGKRSIQINSGDWVKDAVLFCLWWLINLVSSGTYSSREVMTQACKRHESGGYRELSNELNILFLHSLIMICVFLCDCDGRSHTFEGFTHLRTLPPLCSITSICSPLKYSQFPKGDVLNGVEGSKGNQVGYGLF